MKFFKRVDLQEATRGFEREPRAEQEDGTPSRNTLLRGNARFPAADLIGARAVITQALDEEAGSFCERFGFKAFADREPPMRLLRISDLRSVPGG